MDCESVKDINTRIIVYFERMWSSRMDVVRMKSAIKIILGPIYRGFFLWKPYKSQWLAFLTNKTNWKTLQRTLAIERNTTSSRNIFGVINPILFHLQSIPKQNVQVEQSSFLNVPICYRQIKQGRKEAPDTIFTIKASSIALKKTPKSLDNLIYSVLSP